MRKTFYRFLLVCLLCTIGHFSLVAKEDPGLETPVVNVNPLPEYDYANLDYFMTLGIARTHKGRLWNCWISGGDSEEGFLLMNKSDDNGETWSKPMLVIDPHDKKLKEKRRVLVAVPWVDPDGRLWLFFDLSMKKFDGRAGVWYTICDNPDAKEPVWSKPVRIWHGSALNKPTVLSDGSWVLPIVLWQKERIWDPYKSTYLDLDKERKTQVFVSKDKGKTWEKKGGVLFEERTFDEVHITELKDGRLWMTCRVKRGIDQSFSNDKGLTWTKPVFFLPNNSARHFIRRLKSGNLLLVKNGELDEAASKRVRLKAYLSKDDGKTWLGGLSIDERTNVTYPDGDQAPDGTIYVSYDLRGKQILMARFKEQDVIDGAYNSPGSKNKIALTPDYSVSGIKPLNTYPLNSHDISCLLPWGPYSKRYAGISHIPHKDEGLRFDFSVMPGYYRNKQLVPHVLFESSYFPWDFSPSMKRITYRYQLEWKDRVYVDVTYYMLDKSRVLVEMKSVNNTSINQNLIFNNMAYIDYPESASKIGVSGGDHLKWYSAIDYSDLDLVVKTPQYNLVYDGWMRNEQSNELSVSRSVLGKGFGKNAGDKVSYKVTVGDKEGILLIRYLSAKDSQGKFYCKGLVDDTITLKGTGNFEQLKVPYRTEKEGEVEFSLQSVSPNTIQIDGFFVGGKNDFKNLSFAERVLPFTPELEKGKTGQDFILKYKEIDSYYGVAWNYKESEIREVLNSELESFFRRKVHDHVSEKLIGDKNWHYTNAFLRPIVLAPHSEQKLYTLISAGDKMAVEKDIEAFHKNPKSYVEKSGKLVGSEAPEKLLPGGKEYLFGKQLLQASILSNISYPIYTQREYIRHFTPGKNWNSLYTWDLGFIALGLLDIDEEKAFEAIKAYTTPVGSQSAFIHHGTPMPIQMFAYLDLWNKTENKEMLAFLYPRLKQYYDFMVGNNPTSTTRMKGSNLLRTWDYFYNSGGWDDYPPQQYFHKKQPGIKVTPAVSTAAYIRAAKILRMAAKDLGYKQDVKEYDKEIKIFSDALQKYSWDPEAAYFSYVLHNDKEEAVGVYKYEKDQSNFNKGLDGVYPLISGICTPEQEEALIAHLFSEKELWTSVGISTVDQSASYYKNDGYWNGAVWMPHQWSMWKALLDCGKGELAFKIAQKALQVWEKECQESNYTFEHFIISSGRGAGWHQFSGLSCPVINWFASYYKVGKVTTGFEIWIENAAFNDDYTEYKVQLHLDDSTKPHMRSMLVCLNPDFKYAASFNGKQLPVKSYHAGLCEITLPSTNSGGELKIVKEKK